MKNKPLLNKTIDFLEGKDIAILRLSVIAIFLLFGTYKWFDFEVHALEPIINGTWLEPVLYSTIGPYGASYFLGIVENLVFIGLILGFTRPIYGAAASVIVILTGLVTLSLLPQLGRIDSFIIKDLLLIGAGLVLLRHDLVRVAANAKEDAYAKNINTGNKSPILSN